MTGTTFKLTIEDQAARAALGRLADVDVGDLLPRLGEYLLRATQDRFKTQTAPDGTPWAPLQPRYARRKKYNRDKILTLRGYLRSGIRYQVTGPDEVEVGTNLVYAAIHQLGGAIAQHAQSRKTRFRTVAGRTLFAKSSHKRGVTERWVSRPAYQANIPARPYLGVSAADEAALRDIVLRWVVEQGK